MLKQVLVTLAAISSMYLIYLLSAGSGQANWREASSLAYLPKFSAFKQEHGKKYSSVEEEAYRLKVFIENSKMIDEHNRSNSTYTLEMNQLGDMTWEELRNYYLGEISQGGDLPVCEGEIPSASTQNRGVLASKRDSVKKTKSAKEQDAGVKAEAQGDLPRFYADDEQKVDWNALGKVTPVKNQKNCGSCYAFSAIASTESLFAIKNNKQVLLSEQQAVDCSRDYGNHYCGGGFISRVFHYAMEHGLETEDDYPYKGTHGDCLEDPSKGVVKLAGCKKVETNMSGLLAAIRVQPVSVAFEALMTIFFYKFGIYNPGTCGKQVNHAVLAVGFDLTYKTPYLLIKNSWGSWWGRSGYLYMAIGSDPDGVCNVAGSGHNYVPKLD